MSQEENIVTGLAALRALSHTGSVTGAAVELRLTTSAVSKRLTALEATVGRSLKEPAGRGVRLTPEGERLLAEADPLLAQLRAVVADRSDAPARVLKLAITESALVSWAPAALRAALDSDPALKIELHAHRGPVVIDRVGSGRYDLGICTVTAPPEGLVVRELGDEPMVIVPRGLLPLTGDVVPVWTLEAKSATWQVIEGRVERRSRAWGFTVRVDGRLESAAALVQVARAGFAHALVPRGTALALGVPPEALVALPGLARPVGVIGRHHTLAGASVARLVGVLRSRFGG